jgi:hypothetical protein
MIVASILGMQKTHIVTYFIINVFFTLKISMATHGGLLVFVRVLEPGRSFTGTNPPEDNGFLREFTKLSDKHHQRLLVAKRGEAWRELSVNVACDVSLSYSAGIFSMP